MQAGRRAAVLRAAAVPLKPPGTAVISLPWVYALPQGLGDQADQTQQADVYEAEPELAAVACAELATAYLLVRSVAYPA